MPFRLELVTDASGTLRALGNVSDAMDDVADSLDDVARDAQRSSDAIDRELRDVARGAEDSSDRVERTFRQAFDEVKREAKQTGDRAGDDLKDGFRKAERSADDFRDTATRATADFKDEAKQNFAETASSFDGSMESVADMAQGTLGGLASAGGPIGLAAGAIGALGGAFYERWRVETENVKTVVGDMYDDLIESGADYLSREYQQNRYWQILKDEADDVRLAKIQEIASWAMTTDAEVALAYSGNVDAMQRVTDGLIAKRAEFQAQLEDEIDTNDSAAQAGINYVDEMIAGLDEQKTRIEETVNTVDRQRRAWEDTENQVGETLQAYQDAHREVSSLPAEHVTTLRVQVDEASVAAVDARLNRLANVQRRATITPTTGGIQLNGVRYE